MRELEIKDEFWRVVDPEGWMKLDFIPANTPCYAAREDRSQSGIDFFNEHVAHFRPTRSTLSYHDASLRVKLAEELSPDELAVVLPLKSAVKERLLANLEEHYGSGGVELLYAILGVRFSPYARRHKMNPTKSTLDKN